MVALFPLRTVLVPGLVLPLHIFEPRYRQLTVDLVTGVLPDRQFGVVSIREGWAIDQLQHEGGCVVRFFETVDRRDVWVVERGQRVSLALEAA